MHTPAHLAASVFVWRNELGWGSAAAVALGAVLPDLPMFGFYGYQKWAGRSEGEIWSELYFQQDWQLFFDVFNSIPAAILLMLTGKVLGWRWGMLCAASALLHMVCDLPLHNDDAHGHFLPFTDWHFVSPLSYWDPEYNGHYFVWFELAFAIGACTFVSWKGKHVAMRSIAICTLCLYLAGIVFVLTVWLPQLYNYQLSLDRFSQS